MTECCFPRHVRLLNARDYQSVFDDTFSKFFAGEFLLLARKRNDDKVRLGLIVKRKTDKRAVGRNRIKRLVRDSFRKHKTLLAGMDIIFLSHRSVKELDNKTLHKHLEKAWDQLARKSKNTHSSQKQTYSTQK